MLDVLAAALPASAPCRTRPYGELEWDGASGRGATMLLSMRYEKRRS